MYLYSSFAPATPLTGLLYANDDIVDNSNYKSKITGGALTAHGNSAISDLNEYVANLTAGATYTIVVTSFQTGVTGTVGFTVTGPGAVTVSANANTVGYAPTATTGAASGTTQTGATLNGTVNDNNDATTATFDYGLTTGYGTNVAATTGGTVSAGSGSTATAVTIAGLTCNTTYHFRVKGVNSYGTANGSDASFTTSACTYSVTYNGNGNTGGSAPTDGSSPYANGATVTVLGNTGSLAKTGYTFAGWNTAANGSGTSYAPAATFSMGTANVTLYAQWTPVTYTVTYDGNGNTGGSAPTDGSSPYANGATVTVLGNTGSLAKTGYTFAGWNTAANGSGTSYAPAATFSMGTANVTLYAQWTINTPSATSGSASSITATGATLNGTVNDNGLTTTVTFDHGLTTGYGTNVGATTGGTVNAGSGNTATAVAITGLTCNTTYHFRVKATSAGGTTNGSDASFTTSACVPGAPTIGTATAGDTSASVAFSAPGSNGGAAITGYTATSSPGGLTGTCASSPCTVTGLTNGTAYTFTVTATNSAGTGSASAASNSVTPKASQTITFANPGAQNFGTTPTLTASAAPSGLTVSFTSSTTGVCTITSGGALTFVTAGNCTINADQAGDGSYLAAAQVQQTFVVNAVVPGAPTIGTATAGDTSASVAFSAPGSNGGAAITGYTATSSPGGLTGTCASSPCTVTGLTNGTAYTFTVTATNSAGTGSASAASNSVTPKASQTITFANPGAQNFGTTPTLTASAAPSGLTVSFTSSTTGVCTITSGGALTFVTAGNCTINADQAGDGSYLAAAQVQQTFVVNAVVPGAPTIGTATAGDTQATVTFTAPASNGGATITGYTATSSPGGITGTCASSPCTATGLTNGQAYTFTVTATNSVGTSSASAASNSVTPQPGPAVVSVAVPANGSYKAGSNLDFTVTWDQNVTVTGTPRIALTIGATTVYANYVNNPTATTTLFRYTVLAGQTDTDGIAVGALGLNGGTIQNAINVNATLTLNSVGGTASVLVDTTAPTLPAANIVVNNQADPHKIVLTFSEALAPASIGTADGWTTTANGGSPTYSVASVAISGGNTIVTLTLNTVDLTGTTTYIPNSAANGHLKITPPATLTDVAGNTYAAGLVTEASATHVLDNTAPTLSAVSASSPTSSGGTLAATASEKAKGYWVAVATGAAAPTVAEVKAGANYGAVTVVAHGSGTLPNGSAGSLSLTGLSASTAYDIHLMAEDAAGNPTAAISSGTITTSAAPAGGGGGGGSAPNTLPSGGGSAAPQAGQTVTVTNNGSSGSTISLPPPSTGSNTVNISLPGSTGTVSVNSNSAGTQLGVQNVTLPGSTTPVTTVTVDQGSATLTATRTGQPVVGLKNGIIVVSGSDNSKVTVDTTGSAATIAVQTSDTIIVPTGSPNVSGTVVNLPAPPASGSAPAITVQTGGQSLNIQSNQANTSMTFKVFDIGGTQTPVLAVSGSAQITAGGANQPLVSVGGGGNVIRTGGSGSGQQCSTVVQASSGNSGDVVHVVSCQIVLQTGTFSALNGGKRNGFAAIKDGIVWGGETVALDQNGKVIVVYLGTKEGTSDAVGDNLDKGGNSFTAGAYINHVFIPRLAGAPERLQGAKLDESVFQIVNQALGTTTAPHTPIQSSQGVLRFNLKAASAAQIAQFAASTGGDDINVLPSNRIYVDTSRADGIRFNAEGDVEVATSGLVSTFVPAVTDPRLFAIRLAQALPGAISHQRWNVTWYITTADALYVGRPQWETRATAFDANVFSSAADNNVMYSDNGIAQILVPDFHDYNTLSSTFAKDLNDPSLSLLPNMDGTVKATVNGVIYILAPRWTLLKPAEAAGMPAWWMNGSVFYIKNADGSAQGFTVVR